MTRDLVTERLRCMGCDIVLRCGDAGAARRARHLLERFDAELSRFDPRSALSDLNASPHATVPAPTLLRTAVRAALWAAERSGGLVDPTLLDEIERQGYRTSLAGARPAPLAEALAAAPARRRGRPDPRARWRAIAVDDAAGTITRPPGTRLDTGGSTKGLAADAVAALLGARDDVDRGGDARAGAGAEPLGTGYVVDCAGDLRVEAREPLPIAVEHPLTRAHAITLHVSGGAVATSGIGRRVWRRPDGGYAHHLLDPATGEPAWTGLLQVTALAPTALEAETIAKAALLGGPARGRAWLACAGGGVLIHDDGAVEHVRALAVAA